MECNIKFILFAFLSLSFTLGADEKYIIEPTNYNLKITTTEKNFQDKPAEEDLRFSGKVIIDFNIKKVGENDLEKVDIILNSNTKMKIGSTGLQGRRDKLWEDIRFEKKLDKDLLIVSVPKYDSKIIDYQLTVEYTNVLENDMTGFYRSSYVDSSNKTRWLLTTHFEPVYARKAFPCFDRPDLKATFEIEITAPKGMPTVLSNTKGTKIEEKGQAIFKFEKSLKMSTYLVAFTVSDFIATDSVEFDSNYPDGVLKKKTLTTYGRTDIIQNGHGKLAQVVGKAAVTELSNYLNLGYALEKIDLIGIPDFSAGAMENWGHISFREKSLFFDNKSGATLTKQANILTITHELVHQWFGNLVTLESWNYIWLNEAFANYLEYVIASKLKDPDTSKWELMKQMVVNELHLRAFETDGLTSAKPLNNNITDENLILPSFNDIPYAKGASVLRMWHNALGEEKFQKILQSYVKERQLQTANPDQLYEFFKKEAKMEKDFFSTWTTQAGYPLVEVKRQSNGTYALTQKRFLWNNSTSDNATWLIPITYSTDNCSKFDIVPTHWLYKNPLSLNITGKWFLLNNQQSGYYRVNYDQENWKALSEALKKNHSVINEINRAQIINDVYSLARSLQGNYVNYTTALSLTNYLNKEQSFFAWKTALNAFDFLQTKLRESDINEKFNEYVLKLVEPHYKLLNFSSIDHIEKLKNIEIFRWTCSLGQSHCIDEAKKLFNESNYDFLPDIQEIVFCTAVRHLDAFDKVFAKYLKEEDSSLKIMYISSLGCTNNVTKAERLLNVTLEENTPIRKQDLSFVLSSVYNGNLKHVDTAFKFIEKNFKKIAQNYGGINPLGKALIGIAKKLNSKGELERLKQLVQNIRLGEEGKAAKDSLDNALNIAENNLEWVNQRMSQIRKYLNAGSFMTYSLTIISLSLFAVFNF